MHFDTIIIGGGLTALTAGISLAQRQRRVAIVGAGQSTLYFNAGSLDLLGYGVGGEEITQPFEAIIALPDTHPYKKVGDVASLAHKAQTLLKEAGIHTHGSAGANHYRLTPVGELAPTWLTLDRMVSLSGKQLPYQNVTLVNIEGFLDFQVNFLKPALEKMGAKVTVKTFATAALEEARQSPSEFRATSIAKYLDKEENLKAVAEKLNAMGKTDMILLPAVMGIANDKAAQKFKAAVGTPVNFVATMHPSVPGVRMQTMLRKHFESLGGMFISGDTVDGGEICDGKVQYVTTHNMADERLTADNYILATGSFMSQGLQSNYQEVWEPVFHLDIDTATDRKDWHNDQFFAQQRFMSFGVKTDSDLHAMKGGKAVTNLYAAGSVLSDNDFVSYGSHEGVDMLTALQVADNICQ